MSTSEPIVVNVNEDLSSESFLEPKKPKKPFKVHYYKDQKTLQRNFIILASYFLIWHFNSTFFSLCSQSLSPSRKKREPRMASFPNWTTFHFTRAVWPNSSAPTCLSCSWLVSVLTWVQPIQPKASPAP